MRKTLLLMAAMLISSVSFAQKWTAPQISESMYQEMKTSKLAANNEGDSTIYYLYNIDAKAFLNGGAAPNHSKWSTNAILASSGLKIMVAKYELTETANADGNVATSEAAEWDGKTYILYDYWTAKSAWMGIILTDYKGCFIDRGSQIDYKWEINPVGDSKVYRINTADVNPTYSNSGLGLKTSYFGFNGLDVDYADGIMPITPAIDMESEDVEPHVDWAFISEGDYALYNAKNTLYELLVQADTSAVEYEAESAVYNNAASTIEEINAAAKSLEKAIRLKLVYKVLEGASEDSPKDATSLIKNADFSAGNINGWTCTFVKGTNATNIGYQANKDYSNSELGVTVSKFIEAWANSAFSKAITSRALGNGELSQTLEDLPAGKYGFTVDCISSNQDGQTPVVGVQLFATGGSIDKYVTIATGNGVPEHFELVFFSSGGDTKLGLRTNETNANWIAADNFQLTYYGPVTESPEKLALDGVLAQAKEQYDPEDMGDVRANANDKKAYVDAYNNAASVTSDYLAEMAKVSAALDTLKTSVAAYAKLNSAIEECRTIVSKNSYKNDLWNDFDDYVNGNDEDDEEVIYHFYYYGIFTQAEMDSIISDLYERCQKAICEELKTAEIGAEGLQCNSLLVNPSFETGDLSGWNVSASGNSHGNSTDCGVKKNEGDVYKTEGFDGSYLFNIWAWGNPITQTVCNIPNGVYKLQASVASDPGAVYLIGNGSYNAVKIEKQTEEEATKTTAREGEVLCIVTNDTLVVGAVGGGENGEYVAEGQLWYKADNFRLTYMGNSPAVYLKVSKNFVNELTTFVGNNEDAATTEVITLLSEIDDEYTALTKNSEVTVEQCLAFYNKSKDAVDYAKTSVALFTEIGNSLQGLYDAIGNATYVTIKDEASAYYDANNKKYTDGNFTVKEMNEVIAKCEFYQNQLSLPANLDEASDDNPVAMTSYIKNADMEEGADKVWTSEKQCQNGPKWDNGFSSKGMEYWHGNAADMNFNFYQTIKGLPAGKYELTVEAANSLNGQEDNENAGRAYLYAKTSVAQFSTAIEVQTAGCNEHQDTYTVVFELVEAGDVTVGLKTDDQPMRARWFAADNFTLSYLGTNSTKEVTIDQISANGIEEVDAIASQPVSIHTISGVRVANVKKGFNVIKMADGRVIKVVVR